MSNIYSEETGRFPYYGGDEDDSDVFAGRAPIPGDPRVMGQVIHDELARRNELDLRESVVSILDSNGGEMPVGDLLGEILDSRGAKQMGRALCLLYELQTEGETIICVNADSQRIVVEHIQ